MKWRNENPELEAAIAAHAGAIVASNASAAEAFLAPDAMEVHRAFVAKRGKGLRSFEALARSKIGFHYISKVRFQGDAGPILALFRWRERDGKWEIASVEDSTDKRSPWSDLETPPALRRMGSANG